MPAPDASPDISPPSGHWTAVHLFHQGDLDVLLLDAVVPELGRLARTGTVGGHFFLRYWEGGPHLRVRVRSAKPLGDAAGHLVERWNDWLARHPSPCTVDEAAYHRFATAAAQQEHLPAHEPWRGLHDTAQIRPYRPEHDRYGTGASLAAVERHFVEASDCARALLARRPSPAERLSAAFAVLLLTWTVTASDAGQRLAALRAGAESWRRMLGAAYDTEGFDRAYERARPGLLRRAAGLLATPVPAAPGDGPLAAWHHSVARLHASLAGLERAGAFAPDLAALRDDPSLLALPSPRTALTANRCAHLMCNRLGLDAAQEAMLRHFAARAAAALGDSRP
ncbi:lantibiotic biosynthesis protein [Streptomyces mobaraensis NBRC 13819 = DSM 40847]|uniref:Lantibiotic biosynthesis protein n=1 Tax=Streptomyces mobaraensis (strain ATCC 29032 / DSM 40847 / JCM 4168 / NBRC 13819 / NCIMB 11159 / IPCR 16-22) TaxID=1223523 RepID=M3BQL8_STRM1|nr:lantibiotic dehydratase C-terminal domain-containing protein [Streptomyces mobaraensis]EMF02005.1 lantibiotic biosynthesis protein [Streptomyces mobaraensis NBRC 13819 = DSM 40847]